MAEKHQVIWTCPHCSNEHNWWWNKQEATDESEIFMQCDRCDKTTKCKGDGFGYFEPVLYVEEENNKRRSFDEINATLDELQTSRQNHFSLLTKLSAKLDDFEKRVNRHRYELDNIGRRLTTAELAIANLEEGEGVNTYANRKKKPSANDFIYGEKAPFYKRFREGCEFDEETMPGESIAKILRFIAVEVERMTERDMSGIYTVSNLKVGENLRKLADEALFAD